MSQTSSLEDFLYKPFLSQMNVIGVDFGVLNTKKLCKGRFFRELKSHILQIRNKVVDGGYCLSTNSAIVDNNNYEDAVSILQALVI